MGSEVGLPHRWQNIAPSTSLVPQVQNSGMIWHFQFDIARLTPFRAPKRPWIFAQSKLVRNEY
jgi:hypothetical protein